MTKALFAVAAFIPVLMVSEVLPLTLLGLVSVLTTSERSQAQTQSVSIIIVRHAETDASKPTRPLSPAGRQRVELLVPTLRDMKFTHIFATHTTRAGQTVEAIAALQALPIVRLPAPGSMLNGQPVNDETSRRAPIEPIAEALLTLPAGSVALAALNSENIYAILNKLGVPVAPRGQSCAPGSMCVPCTDNTCFPQTEFDQLWYLVIEPGHPGPSTFIELHYGAGWHSTEH
jgi:hypothetical protein